MGRLLSRRQTALAVVVWLLVFGGFITLFGVDEFVDNVATLSAREIATLLVAVVAGVVAMGGCLYVLARSLGLGLGPVESIFLNTSVSLAHNLTPFGQASGVPIGAAIITTRAEGSYEQCLAALSAKDVVSFVPAILVFVVGGGYIGLSGVAIPDELRPVFAAFALFVVTVCAVTVAVSRYPGRATAVIRRVVGGTNRLADRLPLVPSLDESEVERRLTEFTDSFGALAGDRPTIVLASALATGSFLAQGWLLWLALGAVGVEVPLALAIFAVPVSLLASGLPLPGGTGGVESVQILMLVGVTGAALSPTGTAVILSRGLVYWTPIVLGSVTLLGLQVEELPA